LWSKAKREYLFGNIKWLSENFRVLYTTAFLNSRASRGFSATAELPVFIVTVATSQAMISTAVLRQGYTEGDSDVTESMVRTRSPFLGITWHIVWS